MNSIMEQRRRGRDSIVGFMLESNLHEGRQSIPDDKSKLAYGVSITDACISFDTTEEILDNAFSILDEIKD